MCLMDSGALNKRVSIMKYQEIKNNIGEIEQKLVEVKKVWAFITSLAKGKEYIENKKIQQKLIYKIIIRYNNFINQSMFIRYKDKDFNIKDIVGKDLNGPYLTLYCEEKADDKYGR
ncbi:MAG: phage head closure protein [Sarcina sp.]